MADAVGNIHVALYVDTGQTKRFSSAAGAIERDSNRIRSALNGTSRSVTHLQTQMSVNMRSRMFSDMIRQSAMANNELAKLRATMLGLAALTGTSVTGAFAATWLLQTADRAKLLHNQLRTVTNSSEELLSVQKRLYDLSQTSRSSMDATVRLYSRLSRAAEFFGMKQEDLIKVTETVQKAFAIGGASQAEAQGAAIQLSQGIASDRFSGEEYRSVAENAPVLLQEMAKGLGVTIGKLREMAHAGELTGKVVAEAILGASGAIDADFAKTSVTVGQAMTRVGNAFLMYIGESDASLGVTRRLSDALSALAENFEEIATWGAMIAGLGAAAFGGRLLSSGSKSLIGAVVPSKAERLALRAHIREIAVARMAIRNEMASLQASLVTQSPMSGIGPTRPDQFGRDLAAKQRPMIEKALAEEARVRQLINKLEVDHLIATEQLNNARAAGIAGLRKEVEVAKARNAADAKRVGDTMKAVAAERELLKARRQIQVMMMMPGPEAIKLQNAPLESKRLTRQLEAEAKAMKAFDESLGTLRTKMQTLSTALTEGFSSAATNKLAGQVNDVERRLAGAQKRLLDANKAVGMAYAGDASAIAAAEAERAAAIAQVNALQDRSNQLTAQASSLVTRLTASQKALQLVQRAGASVLNFLGGWTGVAFMAAIAGFGAYSAEVAKAEERTSRLKAELNELGLISDEVAGVVDKASRSLEALAADEIRNKLREIAAEMARMRGEQNLFEKIFSYDPKMLGNMRAELDEMLSFGGRGKIGTYLDEAEQGVARSLQIIIDRAEKGDVSVEALLAELDRMAKSNPNMDAGLDKLISNLRLAAPYLDGLQKRTEQLEAAVQRLGDASGDWIMEHAASMAAMEAANATTKAWLESLQGISTEMQRVAALSPEDARLEKTTDAILKAWEEINEEKGLSATVSREMAEVEARAVIAAEDAAKAEEDRAEALKKSAEQIAKYVSEIDSLNAEIRAAGDNIADRSAADSVRDMVSAFVKGKLEASQLKTRLDGIAKTNISAGMVELIGKIQQAIPVMARLLQLFRMIPGNRVGGGGGLDGAAISDRVRAYGGPAGVTSKYNTELLADSKLTPEQLADKVELQELMRGPEGGIGMSEEAARAFQDRLKANRAEVDKLTESTKSGASEAEKYAEKMAEFSRELALAPLDDFIAEVVSTAESMGIASSELDAFVATVSSDGLDAAPEKFRKIADAMREIKAIDIMQDLQFEQSQIFRSDVDQDIYETLRNTGIEAESAYGKMIASQIRLNDTMKTTKDLSKEFLSGLVADLNEGVPLTDALANAFGRLGQRLLDMAMDQAINALLGQLFGAVMGGFGGGAANGIGPARYAGGGGFFGIPGFDTGGYTGAGPRDSIAGLVHKEEFVANASATRRYRPMLEAMNNGSFAGFGGAAPGETNINVQIIRTPGKPGEQDRVETSKNADGGVDIKAYIIDTVVQSAGKRGTTLNRLLRSQAGSNLTER